MNDFATQSNQLSHLALLPQTDESATEIESNGDQSDLNPRWDRAIIALLSEPNLAQAANGAGISQATLWRWMQVPDFARRYRQAQRMVMGHTIARLQATASDAAAVLHEVATNLSVPAGARVAASKAILETATRAAELDVVTERMADLERDLAEMRRAADEARLAADEEREREYKARWGQEP